MSKNIEEFKFECPKCGASNSVIVNETTGNLPVNCSRCGAPFGRLKESEKAKSLE